MAKKYTPGPWYPIDYSGFWVLQKENFYSDSEDLLSEEKCIKAKANAMLSSAAPELLETLIEVIKEEWGMEPDADPQGCSRFAQKVLAIIKKATSVE